MINDIKLYTEEKLSKFSEVDWDDMHTVNQLSDQTLRLLSKREILTELVNNLMEDDTLVGMAEHFDHFDKLVLHRSEKSKTRLRLHVFGDKFIEEATAVPLTLAQH